MRTRPLVSLGLLALAACSGANDSETSGTAATGDTGDTAGDHGLPPEVIGVDVLELEIPGSLHVQGLALPARMFVPRYADLATTAQSAVLVMHGSGGLTRMPDGSEVDRPCSPELEPQFARWGQRLAELGHVVLMPASYDARGFCDRYNDEARIPADFDDDRERLVARVYDLDASSRFLCMRPEVDCDRLGLLGFSHGASTVMLSQHWELGRALDDYATGEGAGLDIIVRSPPPGAPKFSLAIGYYPGCGLESVVHFGLDASVDPGALYFPATDLYIEHGSADPLIEDCSSADGQGRRQLQSAAVAEARGIPDRYHITVHPGADHGFDNAGTPGSDEGSGSQRPEDIAARDAALDATLAHLAAAID